MHFKVCSQAAELLCLVEPLLLSGFIAVSLYGQESQFSLKDQRIMKDLCYLFYVLFDVVLYGKSIE